MIMTLTEDFRREPPLPLAARPLNLPVPEEVELSNGLRVVVVEDRRLPLVSYRLALRFGSAHDPQELPGVADALTTMLTEGTASLNSRELADEIARLGATITAGASADYSTVAASALAQYGDRVLELLADVALRPSLPENELEIVRQNAIQGLIAQRGQPAFLANERISRVIFGDHPYATISPTQKSLELITVATLRDFHRAHFVPGAAVLFVVGDVRRDELLRRAEDFFGSWSAGSPPAHAFPAPPPAAPHRKAYVVDRVGSAQSNIVIANLGLTRTSRDYFPLLLAHTVLGANASSRLFMNLREDKGYTYGAYSSLDARREAGSFRATAEVRTPVTGDSLKEFFYELGRIRQEEVTDKELGDAKSFLTGVFPIRLETQEGLIEQLVQIKMLDLPADYLHKYREHVGAVTKEDLRRAAEKYITPDRAAIVVVGDAREVVAQIKPYAADVEIYNSAGKRKDSSRAAEPIDLAGVWALTINVPGGQLPATLSVNRTNNHLSGALESEMGRATFEQVIVDESSFGALVAFEMHGQTVEGKVSGDVEGAEISGLIELSVPGAPPLAFTGARQ